MSKPRFALRACGSNDFVSKVDPDDRTCAPPGSVDYVTGWDNPNMLKYDSKNVANVAKIAVQVIDGVHINVEEVK